MSFLSPVYTIQPVVKPVTGFTTGCIVYTNIQPVDKPCLSNRLSNPFDNRFDNRLYRTCKRGFIVNIAGNVPFIRLHPGSATALGPALLISVFMASKVVGSKVVLCTDGCANAGLGQLRSSIDNSAASEFYRSLGETASSKACVPFLSLFTAGVLVKNVRRFVKAKFHYASWFGVVRSWFEAGLS